MTREELLKTEFASACEAMEALQAFLEKAQSSYNDSRSAHQDLYVMGNRIYTK